MGMGDSLTISIGGGKGQVMDNVHQRIVHQEKDGGCLHAPAVIYGQLSTLNAFFRPMTGQRSIPCNRTVIFISA